MLRLAALTVPPLRVTTTVETLAGRAVARDTVANARLAFTTRSCWRTKVTIITTGKEIEELIKIKDFLMQEGF